MLQVRRDRKENKGIFTIFFTDFFSKMVYFYIMWMGVLSACVCVPLLGCVAAELLSHSCELPCGCWELNLEQEQQVLPITDLPLQLHRRLKKMCVCLCECSCEWRPDNFFWHPLLPFPFPFPLNRSTGDMLSVQSGTRGDDAG